MKNLTRLLPVFLLVFVFSMIENPGAGRSAQPTPYERQADFSDHSQNFPSQPHNGTDMDSEFNAVKDTLDDVLTNLELIQRDDGELANNSVGPDQLRDEVDLGLNPVGDWATATAYEVFDAVWQDRKLYRCLEEHTSGTFATDLAADKWVELLDFDQYIDLADTAATAADTSADAAAASATAAASSASSAASSAATAQATAATLVGTSATSITVGTGTKVFTTQSGKQFFPGFVYIVSASSPTSVMHGHVASYSGTTLTVDVTYIEGTGTYTDWIIVISGAPGPTGATGATGAAGAGSGDVVAANYGTEYSAGYATLRDNIGLGSPDGPTFNTVNLNENSNQIILDADGANTTTISISAPSANRTITLPNATGTVALLDATQTLTNKTIDDASNTITNIDGENIVDDTIDDDSIDWLDVTAADITMTDATTITASGKITANANVDVKNGSTTAGVLALFEDSDDGTEKVTFKAQAMSADTAYTMPADDGSANEILSTNGSGVLDWVSANTGDWVLIEIKSLSNNSTADFTNITEGDCAAIKFIWSFVEPSIHGANLYIRTSTDNGSTFAGSSNNYAVFIDRTISSGTTNTQNLAAPGSAGNVSTAIKVCDAVGTSYGSGLDGCSGEIIFFNPSDTVHIKTFQGHSSSISASSDTVQAEEFFGQRRSTSDMDAWRFLFSSGNLQLGTIAAYCLTNS